MKRIYNIETQITIWTGNEYLVDGIVSTVDPPLYLLVDVEKPKPEYNPLTHKLLSVSPFPDISRSEWVKLSWETTKLTNEDLVQLNRKIWMTVSDFWSEFSNEEKYAIEVSQDPTLIVLRADLKLWLKDVWNDDPRIQFAMGKLVELGILSEERKTQILTKTS